MNWKDALRKWLIQFDQVYHKPIDNIQTEWVLCKGLEAWKEQTR